MTLLGFYAVSYYALLWVMLVCVFMRGLVRWTSSVIKTLSLLLIVGCFYLAGAFIHFPGRFYIAVGVFTFPGRAYTVGVVFTLPWAFYLSVGVFAIYCVGAFTSAWAILPCQERFCKLTWVYYFAVGIFTSVWAHLLLRWRFCHGNGRMAVPSSWTCLLAECFVSFNSHEPLLNTLRVIANDWVICMGCALGWCCLSPFSSRQSTWKSCLWTLLSSAPSHPLNGYCFRILTASSASAPLD